MVITMLFAELDSARADVVGSGYTDVELVDLWWATEHLGYKTPADIQRAGVLVVDFVLQISGRSESECGLDYAEQIDPYGPHRFATDWTGADLLVLDRVAGHYCLSREQAQIFGATILTFFAGLDAGLNGSANERRPLAEIDPPEVGASAMASGIGSQRILLDEPPPVDHRVVSYMHAGSGTFRVLGRDITGELVEVLVERSGTATGSVLVNNPGSFASLVVEADGEWMLSFEPLSGLSDLDLQRAVLGLSDQVYLVPSTLQGRGLRFRHIGSGPMSIRSLGSDGVTNSDLISVDGDVVSRLRIPADSRILELETSGEWGLVGGDILPPGRPPSVGVRAADASVYMSWRPPASGGTAITSYQLAYRSVPTEETTPEWTTIDVGGTSRSFWIDALLNGAAYQVRIRAVNAIGAGLWTSVSTVAPMASVETVVVDGLAATAGDQKVELVWSPPSSTQIESYTLVYFDQSRVNSAPAVIRGALATLSPGKSGTRNTAQRTVHRLFGLRWPTIVGGAKVVSGTQTHAVALIASGQPNAYQAHYCGGTLVAPRWVVTAAHCVAEKAIEDLKVVSGIVDLDSVKEIDRIGVKALHVHESYDADRILHDIGLIELVSEAPGTPIPWQEDENLPLAGTSVKVAGWGAVTGDSETYEVGLKEAIGRVLSGPQDSYCGSWRGFEAANELCVGGQPGVGACGGDSGGPVTAELGMERLIGVTSYGLSGACADPTYPNVATRVSRHASWIETRVGDPWQTVTGLTTPAYTVDGLVNGRTYTFYVTAIDAMGRSVGPMAVTVAPVGPPESPGLLSGRGGDEVAVLSWEAAFSASDDPVIDYVVEYSTDGIDWTAFDDGTTTDTELIITGLVNESSLWFRVTAVNSRGSGPPSDSVIVTIGQPDAPSGLVGRTGNGSVDLSWLEPADNGGSPIVDYVVERQIDGGWIVVDDGVSTSTIATVSGLPNGGSEAFRISAVTSVGQGPAGIAVKAVPGQPDPVSQLRADVGDQKVTLSWIAPVHDGGSAVIDYRIEYSIDEGDTWDSMTGNVGSATTTTVRGLRNGQSYWLRVAAVTSIGRSRTTSVVAIPATVPGRATNLMVFSGVEQLVFSWQPPSDGGSAITAVFLGVASIDGEWQLHEGGPLTTTARIGGLVPGMEYRLRVIYENVLGRGEPSEIVQMTFP